MTKIETERLTISPMADEELRALAEQYEAIPELSAAYLEMLGNCEEYPRQRVWYTAWRICLRKGDGEVGYAGFKGFNGGCPEIGYGIDGSCEGNGYATEAVKALCDWALAMPGVTAVEAEAEEDNAASRRVLDKCGFTETGIMGAEGPRYRRADADMTDAEKRGEAR